MPPHARRSRSSSSSSGSGRSAGFTLVECAVACAVVGVFATLALPSLQGQRLRSARVDAVAALTRVQVEQEKHRAQHGLYASDLAALRGVAAASAQGRYTIVVEPLGADAYRAVAQARGEQRADSACAALTLDVRSGFPTTGPSATCWGR